MKTSLANLLVAAAPAILARTLIPRDPPALHCNTDIVPNGLPDPDPQGAAACTNLINDLKTNPSLLWYREITYSAANGSLPQADDSHFRNSDCAMVITANASASQSTFTFNDWVAAVEGILASCMNWGGTAQIGGQAGYTAGVYTERVNLAMLNGPNPQDTPAVPNAAAYVPGGSAALPAVSPV